MASSPTFLKETYLLPMKDKSKDQEVESFPLLPSGDWEGFYCYNHSPEQHKMSIELTFSNRQVSGSGVDDVAAFTWTGKYDLETLKIEMTKHYTTHNVWYKGDIDENGIWGTWEIAHDYSKIPPHLIETIKEAFKDDIMGGFHIWPKKDRSETNRNEAGARSESKKLKELYVEVFA